MYGNFRNPYAFGGLPNSLHYSLEKLVPKHRVTCFTGLWPGESKTLTVDGITYVQKGLGKNKFLNRPSFSVAASFLESFKGFDLIAVIWDRYAPVMSKLTARVPVILDLHADYFAAPSKLKLIEPFTTILLKKQIRNSRYITAVSTTLLENVKKYTKFLRLSSVISSGVPEELISYRTNDKNKENFLLFLGRIDISWKGIDTLIKSYQMANVDVPLLIAGEGPDKIKIKKMIEKKGLDQKIKLLGWVVSDKKFELLSNCLAVCMPSRVEGYPTVAIEAAALGKPIIGSQIVGLDEAVENGRTGILVPIDDVDGYSKAIRALVTDDILRSKLGYHARKKAKGYTWESIAQKREDFFHKVVRDFYSQTGI